jgi:hypothetical protein
MRRAGAAALLVCATLLGACHDLSTIAGVAAGSATGAATANPGVGFAVGVGVSASLDFLGNYITRVRAGAEQDVIAETAGALPAGGEAPWVIRHTVPIGNEQGELRVVDVITTPIAVCKEVVISVIDRDDPRAPHPNYIASVCRDAKGWKWATAEPAVARWGPL